MARKSPTVTKRHSDEGGEQVADDGVDYTRSRKTGSGGDQTSSSSIFVYVYVSVLVSLLAAVLYPSLARVSTLEDELDQVRAQVIALQQRLPLSGGLSAEDPSALIQRLTRQLEQQITQRLDQIQQRHQTDSPVTLPKGQTEPTVDLVQRLHRLEQERYDRNDSRALLEQRYGQYDERLRRLETELGQSQGRMVTVKTTEGGDLGRIINRILYRYMADRTERVDFALESTGGGYVT